MKRWLPHIGVVLGIAIAVYALLLGSTDEDRIRDLLDRLEDAVQVHDGTSNFIIRGSRVRKAFSTIFVKDVRFRVPDLRSDGQSRRALVGLAAQAPRLYRTAIVDLGGLDIKVDATATSATAFGDASLIGVRQGGQAERDQRSVSLRLDKIDGDWRIVKVDVSPRGASQR
jgi:phosphoribosylformylglycinamidine synthase